jgi:hypothetical protein
VDEYESPFHGYAETIDRPFSFKELTTFIESTDLEFVGTLPTVYVELNIDPMGWDEESVEELRNFSSFSSDFYPGLGRWAQNKIDAFLDQGLADMEAEEASCEDEDS